jgi:alkylglycerol monooxygenase
MVVNAYVLSTPIIITLMGAEIIYSVATKKNFYDFKDTVANIGTAVLNQCMNLMVYALAIPFYGLIQQKIGVFNVETSVASFILAVIGIDFLFYWFHRLGHTLNFMWACHLPHHSSEEMNYSVALRTSVYQRLLSILFYWPMAALGFPPEILMPAIATNLILQFWQHTRTVKRLPRWFEAIFNSPTHHRVHHGRQRQYINKNYAGILIIWDKMFGTFEPEGKISFGCHHKLNSYSANEINMQYWRTIFRNMKKLNGIDKVLYFFGPMSWNIPKFGLHWSKVESANLKERIKLSAIEKSYLVLQILVGLALMSFTINQEMPLTYMERSLLSTLVWICVTGWGWVIHRNRGAIAFEVMKVAMMVVAGVWTASKLETTMIQQLTYAYTVVSLIMLAMLMKNKKELPIKMTS